MSAVDLDPRTRRRLNRAVLAARVSMAAERTAAVWAPWLLAAGAVATAGLWGLFDALAAPFDAGVLASAGLAALALSIRGALGVRWPTRAEGLARVESDSGLTHRPFTGLLEDAPAVGDDALWALARAEAEEAAARLKVDWPRAALASADPYAVRYALLLAAALGLWSQGWTTAADRAGSGFHPLWSAGATLNTAVADAEPVMRRAGLALCACRPGQGRKPQAADAPRGP